MLSRERAERALAMRAEGEPVREIARRMGHSPRTIRDYVNGRRIPGNRAPKPDEFALFSDYCRRRVDDPHLVPRALLDEVTGLGYWGGRATFYRALRRHDLLGASCLQCQTASTSSRTSPPATKRRNLAQPLPMPMSPVAGETLGSYLVLGVLPDEDERGRLAEANHITTDDVLTILPPWFHTKIRSHDDRGQHHMLAPAATAALQDLAAIVGRTPAALARALPAFANGNLQDPVRAITACRRCMSARGIHQPVPVHRPAYQQICTRHGLWLSPADRPQFDLTVCPDIITAQHRARRLLRHRTPQQLMFSQLAAARLITDLPDDDVPPRPWQQRHHRLKFANRHLNNPADHHDLVQAAAYPDTLDRAKTILTSGASEHIASKIY